MATVKRVSGNYTIETVGSGTTVTLTADETVLSGNLTVQGTTNTVESTETTIKDNEIELNSGESGAGVTLGTAGIRIDRGSSNVARMVFDESDDTWKVDNGSGSLTALVTGSAGINDVVDDTTPQLGGDLDTNDQSIVTLSNKDVIIAPNGTGTLRLDNTELALDIVTDPSAKAGYNLVYHKAEGSGGTGLYFMTSSTNDELVSKSKAIVFSIIF